MLGVGIEVLHDKQEGECFMANKESRLYEDDFTVEDIITIGIRQALMGTKNTPVTEDKHRDTWRDSNIVADLDIDEDISNDKIKEIVYNSNLVALEHYEDPVWTFSNEKIREGHALLLSLRRRLIQIMDNGNSTERNKSQTKREIKRFKSSLSSMLDVSKGTRGSDQDIPSKATQHSPVSKLKAVQEILGQIFWLLSMFYSNTNWAEVNGIKIYKQLGKVIKVDIIVTTVTDTADDIIYTSGLVGKCEHGGERNNRTHPNSVPGGINKQSSSSEYSPHYFLHKNVAILAIQHIKFYLVDQEFGLLSIIGSEKFSHIFHHDKSQSPIIFIDFVDDQANELLDALLQENINVVNNTQDLRTECVTGDNDIVIIRGSNSSLGQFSLPVECEDHQIKCIHLSKLEHAEQSDHRYKRSSLSGLDAYHLIADVSGGSVYETDKVNIGAVVDIIKESVSAKPPVTVLKFQQRTSSSNMFYIPVDNMIYNLTIKIQSSSSLSSSSMKLYRPDGSEETFLNSSVATKQNLGTKLTVMKIFNPVRGQWNMSRMSTHTLDIDVGANTDLDFFHKFMQKGPNGIGLYPLIGRPIAGDNTSVQVTVPLVDKVKSVDSLLLIDRTNTIIKSVPLHNVGGRRGKALFSTYVEIPSKEFMIAIEGRDLEDNVFRRLDSKIISSLAIQLEVFPTSGSLYMSKTIDISYRVTNVGGGTTTMDVTISDDKNFALSPTLHTHSVSSQRSQNGTFTLKAGTVKGETTTVTISAKAYGAPNNKVQYYVRRFIVEEEIIRVIDTTKPVCNITKITGKCDYGSDICECSNYTWEMSAVVADTGDGLSMVFASNAGNNSNTRIDNFTSGHKLTDGWIHTYLSADCCHQHAIITAVDLAGNVGLCEASITPGFIPPPQELCHPKIQQNSSNTHNISCNVTNIVGSCNTSSLCSNQTWSFEANVGNEASGNLNTAAINAGKNASLTRINNTIYTLTTDCCHTDVTINLFDFPSKTGQCHATIPAYKETTTESSNSQITTESPKSTVKFPVALVAGSAAGAFVAITAITVLVFYCKSQMAANNVVPMNQKFKA
ncbi:von Willebrand factor (vWF) type A domain [Mactra antiquata]